MLICDLTEHRALQEWVQKLGNELAFSHFRKIVWAFHCPLHFGLLHTVDVTNAVEGLFSRVSELISFSFFSEPGSTELSGLFVEKPLESIVAVAG